MNLILDVPYNEKDEAKSLGSKWNPELKKWYYSFDNEYSFKQFKSKYALLKKWLKNKRTNLIVFDYIYISEINKTCYKCHNTVKSILLATDHYFDTQKLSYGKTSFSILFFTELLNNINLVNFLKDTFNYFPSYTKTSKKNYFCNHCTRCGSVSGDFFLVKNLLDSFGTAYIESLSDIPIHEEHDRTQLNFKKSVTHKIILKEAMEVQADNAFMCGSNDIDKLSRFKEIII